MVEYTLQDAHEKAQHYRDEALRWQTLARSGDAVRAPESTAACVDRAEECALLAGVWDRRAAELEERLPGRRSPMDAGVRSAALEAYAIALDIVHASGGNVMIDITMKAVVAGTIARASDRIVSALFEIRNELREQRTRPL
jgi:uncharacterized protein YuzE